MRQYRNRFFLVFRNESGVIYEEELNFNSLINDVAFFAVCGGRHPNDGRWEPVDVEPEWADDTLKAVTVSVAGSSRKYGRAVFRDRAIEVLRTRGFVSELETDEQTELSWDVEVREADTAVKQIGRRASVRHQAYPLVHRTVVELSAERRVNHPLSVWASASLLAELREESANSLDRERADFLTGHLVHEPTGRVAAVFLDRIPANIETAGSLVRFTFSPRTFQAAQRELEQRGSDHVILGWHHNHPPPCGRKCLMTIPACHTENVLFSVDDRVVHRSAFAQPYMVALVSGKGAGRRADDPLMRAYGWRHGFIREREWSIF